MRVIVHCCQSHYNRVRLTHSAILSYIERKGVLLARVSNPHERSVVVCNQNDWASLITGSRDLIGIGGAAPNVGQVSVSIIFRVIGLTAVNREVLVLIDADGRGVCHSNEICIDPLKVHFLHVYKEACRVGSLHELVEDCRQRREGWYILEVRVVARRDCLLSKVGRA